MIAFSVDFFMLIVIIFFLCQTKKPEFLQSDGDNLILLKENLGVKFVCFVESFTCPSLWTVKKRLPTKTQDFTRAF